MTSESPDSVARPSLCAALGSEICDWPGCSNPALCATGNAGGALVCRRHFEVTNGRAESDLLSHEREAMCIMADTAGNRARLLPNDRGQR